VLRCLTSLGTENEDHCSKKRSPTLSTKKATSASYIKTVPSVSSVVTKQRMKKNPSLSSLANKMRLDAGESVAVNRRKLRPNEQIQSMKSLQCSSYDALNPMPSIQKTLIEERMRSKRANAAQWSNALKKFDAPVPLETRVKEKRSHLRSLSLEELGQRALTKLALKAKHWDRGWVSLEGFQGREMEPEEFQTQLQRSLLLRLSQEEVEAVVACFDDDGNGRIDGAEFLKHFFRLGREARRKDTMHNWKKVEDQKIAEKEEKIRKEREWGQANQNAVAKYTDKERERALGKIAKEAEMYNRNAQMDNICLKPFYNVLMRPIDFRNQLLTSFGLKFSKAELGALMDEFDQDRSGAVDGAEFLHSFFKLGQLAQQQRAQQLESSNQKRKEDLMKRVLPQMDYLGR